MPRTVAIVQSSYVPWKGYFDIIRSVDEFVLYDDQQYRRRDWRNWNRIKTSQGTIWLTISVNVKGALVATLAIPAPLGTDRRGARCRAGRTRARAASGQPSS
jgi:WbqC-like protein family